MTLSTSEEAQAARDSLDGSIQAGKSISVRPFQAEPPKREPGAALVRAARLGGGMGGRCRRARPHALRGQPALRRDPGRGRDAHLGHQRRPGGSCPFADRSRGSQARVRLRDHGHRRRSQRRHRGLAGADLRGRRLVVNLAHPKGESPAPGLRWRWRRRWRACGRRWRWWHSAEAAGDSRAARLPSDARSISAVAEAAEAAGPRARAKGQGARGVARRLGQGSRRRRPRRRRKPRRGLGRGLDTPGF